MRNFAVIVCRWFLIEKYYSENFRLLWREFSSPVKISNSAFKFTHSCPLNRGFLLLLVSLTSEHSLVFPYFAGGVLFWQASSFLCYLTCSPLNPYYSSLLSLLFLWSIWYFLPLASFSLFKIILRLISIFHSLAKQCSLKGHVPLVPAYARRPDGKP